MQQSLNMKRIFLLLTLLFSGLLTLSAQTYIYSGDKRYDYDSRVRYTIDGPLPVAVAIYLIL